MKKSCIYTVVMGALAINAQAESMRCQGDLIKIGDVKADVIAECGEPLVIDSFCRTIANTAQIQAVQNGSNNVQNNIAVQACENVDVWTYHPTKGQFITHLYFVSGELRDIKYGDRVK